MTKLNSVYDGKSLPPRVFVDSVGAAERAASFAKRSIKKSSKQQVLKMALSMCDLTTLEGSDTPARVRQLCQKARYPVPTHVLQELGQKINSPEQFFCSVAAVCVYPTLVRPAVEALQGSGIQVASVASAFPSGQAPLSVKILDTTYAVQEGATEIDMVISRAAFLSGNEKTVMHKIREIKKACGSAHLKVILETGELGDLTQVRRAADLALYSGADFIKTSTGKIVPGATPVVTLVMLQAIWDFYQKTGIRVGMKPAGGIRTAKEAIQYLVMVKETLGDDWLNNKMFRFGASTLVNDLLRQIFKELTGRYYYEKAFAID